MRILIFSWRDIKNPEAGGSELYFHELAKNWVKEGNKVYWLTSGFKNSKKNEIIDGVQIFRYGGQLTQYLFMPFIYWSKFKDKVDVIIDNENGIPYFTPLYSRKPKVLHIHHVHKDIWFKELKFPLSWVGYLLEMKMMPLVYRGTRVMCLCKSSAEDILEEGISKRLPKYVAPGIEFVKYKKYPKNKKPTIIFLNRIKKYKGVKTFIDSARVLKNYNFWVVGGGSYLDEMKRYVKDNNLKNVKFFGRVDEKKKHELLQRSWIFVNASHKEGWGIVIIEANYFGTPVIGTNAVGIKDAIIEGKTGLLFERDSSRDLAKKIDYLVKNKRKLNSLSKEAKKWAKRFSWDKMAKKYLKILSNL